MNEPENHEAPHFYLLSCLNAPELLWECEMSTRVSTPSTRNFQLAIHARPVNTNPQLCLNRHQIAVAVVKLPCCVSAAVNYTFLGTEPKLVFVNRNIMNSILTPYTSRLPHSFHHTHTKGALRNDLSTEEKIIMLRNGEPMAVHYPLCEFNSPVKGEFTEVDDHKPLFVTGISMGCT